MNQKRVWKHEGGLEESHTKKRIVSFTIVNVQRNRFEQFIFKSTGNEREGIKSTQSESFMRKRKSPLKESPESLKEHSVTSIKDGNMERKNS